MGWVGRILVIPYAGRRPVGWGADPIARTTSYRGEGGNVVRAANHAATAAEDERWRLGELVLRTADGDDAALAALYDATSALVHGLALRILGDRGAAEEVTIDVYLQVWRQADRWDPARGRPMAWLLTIARTRAIDRRRMRSAVPPAPAAVVSTDDGPEGASMLAQRGRIVRSALVRLSPDQRRAVELAYFGGLSHAEIARSLAEPLGTVKTRIRTAMTRLRGLLAGLEQEPA
jgi:RNA polymerase sigma-70 factor (ECF subfamily)